MQQKLRTSKIKYPYRGTDSTCISSSAIRTTELMNAVSRKGDLNIILALFEGRDDDIVKLKEVLDDILIKTDKVGTNAAKSYRIRFGAADNKIGANLLKLMSMSSKYKIFIPEYPILHLKKSIINNICSDIQSSSSGLLQKISSSDIQSSSSGLSQKKKNIIMAKYPGRLVTNINLVLADVVQPSAPGMAE
ncbi:Hypothetical predicted protein [Mytilus galloprovincialis]|nr:Hypothetical predicted protein [Mytilus galloprovincialis]